MDEHRGVRVCRRLIRFAPHMAKPAKYIMLEPSRAVVSLEARDPSESPRLYDPGVAALSLASPPPPEQETGEPSKRPAVAEDGGQLGTVGVVLKLLLPEKEAPGMARDLPIRVGHLPAAPCAHPLRPCCSR